MKVNQLKAGVVLSYVSMLVTNLISIIYTPIMLRMLGQSEYGLYQLANSVVSYLGLLNFGFGSAFVRFYSIYKRDEDHEGIARLNGMFMICFLVMSLLAIIFGGILVSNVQNIFSSSLTPEEISKTRVLMTLMVFNVALMFPNSVFNANITANEKYLFQRIVSLASSVLNPMLVLMLLFFGFQSIGLVVSATIIAVMKLTVDMYYCLHKLKIRFEFRHFDFKLLRQVWVFSFFIFINMITDMLNYSVDKFVLGMVKGTVNVAIYSVGASMNQYYISFSSAISTVFIPRVNRMVAGGAGDEEITKLFTKIGRIQFIVISLVMSGFVIFGKRFIEIWTGGGYENAYYVALIIMLPTTVPIIQNISIEIQRAKNMHMFRSIVYLFIALGNLAISIPLAKAYGEVGSAAGTGIAVFVGNVVIMNIYNHVKVGLDIKYFWKQIAVMAVPVTVYAVVAYCATRYIDMSNYYTLGLSIFGYTLLFFGVMWIFAFNSYEKELFCNMAKKIIRRK